MNPFQQSDVWGELSSNKRRRVMAALASKQTWLTFMIPGTVTNEQIVAFGRRNLLKGFFERPARIVTGVAGRRVAGAMELRIGFSPHPANVALPAWGCGLRTALKLTFGDVTPMPTANEADAPKE